MIKPKIEVNVATRFIKRDIYNLSPETVGSAGIDLRADIPEPYDFKQDKWHIIPTGLRVWIRNPSLVGLVFMRSSLSFDSRLNLGNSVGVIDSDYQGEIKLYLKSHMHVNDFIRELSVYGKEAFYEKSTIHPGDRIAQLVIVHKPLYEVQMVNRFSKRTVRGESGIGSTGRK